jgi:hypothetical protein
MPASSKIQYPLRKQSRRDVSSDSLWDMVEILDLILDGLGEVADLIESLEAKLKKEQSIRICNTIVTGANELSKKFNSIAKAAKANSELLYAALYETDPCK